MSNPHYPLGTDPNKQPTAYPQQYQGQQQQQQQQQQQPKQQLYPYQAYPQYQASTYPAAAGGYPQPAVYGSSYPSYGYPPQYNPQDPYARYPIVQGTSAGYSYFNPTPMGGSQPFGIRTKVTTTMWEEQKTLCYQVECNGVTVVRRSDNNMINGTKLLNVAKMTRGRRDGILKAERTRDVVKVGSMHLKGVWIPFERASAMAQHEGIFDMLYPLFVKDIAKVIKTSAIPDDHYYQTYPYDPANNTQVTLLKPPDQQMGAYLPQQPQQQQPPHGQMDPHTVKQEPLTTIPESMAHHDITSGGPAGYQHMPQRASHSSISSSQSQSSNTYQPAYPSNPSLTATSSSGYTYNTPPSSVSASQTQQNPQRRMSAVSMQQQRSMSLTSAASSGGYSSSSSIPTLSSYGGSSTNIPLTNYAKKFDPIRSSSTGSGSVIGGGSQPHHSHNRSHSQSNIHGHGHGHNQGQPATAASSSPSSYYKSNNPSTTTGVISNTPHAITPGMTNSPTLYQSKPK
ncbi:unnamed protein product [Ambrosiozyma monospora]|uniref:Unnamed protein product n=1 Tax=Ambrosiozyma monospora TaxID=43982 RepID=A0ACB5T102_AMBMO|nr:unnamed protein product [Ambrosiozyma monospora]